MQGISPPGRTLKINDPDTLTLKSALLERVFYHKVDGKYVEPSNPDERLVHQRLRDFKRGILHKTGRVSCISPEEFAQMYTGRKRTIYDNAVEVYNTIGVTKRDAISSSFVKCEKVPANKSPRCIQPRTPVYNVGVGRYLKPIEHRLYKSIQRVFDSETPVVVKGFNACVSASIIVEKFEQFDNCVALGLDASRFDQHVSKTMLEWEHSIYNSLFNSSELKKLLKWQVNNTGVGYCEDGKVSYNVEGRRFSGDMNTALGNCIIMCALIYTYANERGVKINLANNGDDCVVFMSKFDLNRFQTGLDEWFSEMGFIMTSEEPVFNIEQIEFCQCKPVLGSNGYVMCRNFDKSREKDSMCLLDISTESSARKWLMAVGECGLALTSGIPVMQELYQAYVRNGVKSNMIRSVGWSCGMTYMSHGLNPRYATISEESRESFYLSFGITPDEQVALEGYYRDWNYTHTKSYEDLEHIECAPF